MIYSLTFILVECNIKEKMITSEIEIIKLNELTAEIGNFILYL